MIYTLELQKQVLIRKSRLQSEDLPVFVVSSLEPADVPLSETGPDSALRAHRIVRQHDRDSFPTFF